MGFELAATPQDVTTKGNAVVRMGGALPKMRAVAP